MVKLDFWKMNGAGNDFIMLDNRAGDIQINSSTIARLCDRHRGIGADGLIMAEADENGLRMRYYNSDGGEAEMCGNGARCFSRFAASLTGARQRIVFQTLAGPIAAELLDDGRVRLGMTKPKDFRLPDELEANGKRLQVWFVDTGVPHAVVPVEDVESTDVLGLGRELRHHPRFAPKGTNVNFLQQTERNRGVVRTYERGVEDETLACGTGVTASALVLSELQGSSGPVSLRVRGGDWLEVGFCGRGGNWKNVTLCGPAEFTFHGSVNL